MDYLIRFNEHLDPTWQRCFDNLEITHEITGSPPLSGQLPDQAARYGVLLTIRQPGLTLLSLETREDGCFTKRGRIASSFEGIL